MAEPIDSKAFAELLENVGDDRDFLRELVETYLADTPPLFDELRRAIADGDAATARRAAHTLKSTSASFGANALAGQCRAIEGQAATGDLGGLDADVELAEASYIDVAEALRRAVAEGDAA